MFDPDGVRLIKSRGNAETEGIMQRDFAIAIAIERLDDLHVIIRVEYVDPKLASFIEQRKDFTIGDMRFKANDKALIVSSSGEKLIDCIEGFTGNNFRKAVMLHSEPRIIDFLITKIVTSLYELIHVFEQVQSHRAFGYSQPIIVVHKPEHCVDTSLFTTANVVLDASPNAFKIETISRE